MKKVFGKELIVLWISLAALIIAALIGAPKFWDYCEMRALKAEFDRFVDVENWPEGTEIHMGNPLRPIAEEEASRVKAAIQKLEFDGKHTDERWRESMGDTGAKHVDVFCTVYHQWEGVWTVDLFVDTYGVIDADFGVTNCAELGQVLAELQVKYPRYN